MRVEASLRLSNRPAPAARLTFTGFPSSPCGMYYVTCSVHRLVLSASYSTTCISSLLLVCVFDVIMRGLSLRSMRYRFFASSHVTNLLYFLPYFSFLLAVLSYF